MSYMSFKKLEAKFNLPELEKRVLRRWKRHNVLEKYLSKNENSSKRFSFIDGPITANNPMGVHHARGRSLKDLFQRFKNMQGFKQRFQNGFDCQGLWVEVEVEKSLGFNSKKDIEDYGLAKFTEACMERVRKFAGVIEDQSRRLGYFMDWDNSYFTMSERNNLHIWHFLKKCYQEDLIYKGKSVTAWCPRCETGLSKHEQAGSFKNIEDPSFYVKFKIEGRENEYFLAWTTTPWTLSANVLLALNPDLSYVKAKNKGDVLYLAEEAAKRLNLQNLEKVKAGDLLGLRYVPPYEEAEAQKGVDHLTVEWSEVDPKEGTGVVHIAPGCGEEDFELGKEKEAAVLSPLLPDGRFQEGYGSLSGKQAGEVAEEVARHLRKKGLLFKRETITHSYPHCWRCKAKTVFRAEDNWFIKCGELRPRLLKAARSAHWIPGFVLKRMEDWLENMGDWMISRNRFYGLSLPFYECEKCGKLTVVGNRSELHDLAVNPEVVDSLPSLHRPWIDEVKVRCPGCGEEVERIQEVGDCWLDAGVVPFSTLNYLTDKTYWKKWFPADLITEMVEQVRLWYFSMLVYGVVLEDRIPYENILSYVEVRDEEGREMHKSWGNAIPFKEAAEKMGADAMRWLYFSKKGRAPVNFGFGLARDVKRGFFFTLWNSFRFFANYAFIELEDEKKLIGKESGNALDKWILSRLFELEKTVTMSLEEYKSERAVKAFEDFVRNDLSLWYIRRTRDRIGPQAEDGEDKLACYATFYRVFEVLVRLLAPFIPFLTEKLWNSLGNEESVHLCSWPVLEKRMRDEELEKEMELVREVASVAHKARKKAGIKTRQPLAELEVRKLEATLRQEVVDLLKEEVNISTIYFRDNLKKEKGWIFIKEGGVELALNPDITPSLKKEGDKREIVRNIQRLRKKAGLTAEDKITIFFSGDKELTDLFRKKKEEIKRETIAEKVKERKERGEARKEIEIDGKPFYLALEKRP